MMKKMMEEIMEKLEKHTKWLNNEGGGKRADLRGADLSNADLRDADLGYTDLSNADLRYADLRYTNLRGADLRGVDLSDADLGYADLRHTDLRGVDLSDVNLIGADIRDTNLSGAVNVLSQIDYIKENFEFTDEGVIAYKTFSSQYNPPEKWVIQQGSVITENVNFNRCNTCACGINVAPLDWVRKNAVSSKNTDIWKCLIRWEWLCGVCVPYNTDGKIRCEKVELLEVVE